MKFHLGSKSPISNFIDDNEQATKGSTVSVLTKYGILPGIGNFGQFVTHIILMHSEFRSGYHMLLYKLFLGFVKDGIQWIKLVAKMDYIHLEVNGFEAASSFPSGDRPGVKLNISSFPARNKIPVELNIVSSPARNKTQVYINAVSLFPNSW